MLAMLLILAGLAWPELASQNVAIAAEPPAVSETGTEPELQTEPETEPQTETAEETEPQTEAETAEETEAETAEETEPELPVLTENGLELPINGATGYAPVAMTLWSEIPRADAPGQPAAELTPGTAFVILQEEGDWWQVETETETGWVEHRYCMINLPDVIPSIIYDATNSYSSLYKSSGREIPEVTGKSLYPGAVYNARLEREEYCMPMLYAAAKKVCAAQQAALAQGDSLKIYEAYRPYSVQKAVVDGLGALAKADPVVAAGINTSPWHMRYFIATGYSNHQRGFAVDVSLAKVKETEVKYTGSFKYLQITEYEEYAMPTQMHELSMAAASAVGPGSNELAPTMNEPAIALRRYFTEAGMSPRESEWWHFNDFAARDLAAERLSVGNFVAEDCFSRPPAG